MSVKNNPLVSIIVITYNQQSYIEECILSIINQDYQNIEIIISDDCSTDKTAKILNRLKKKYDDKIILNISSINRGITSNSNSALKMCNGKYICFTGGDDIFFKSKIKKQIKWILQSPERVLCGHDAEIIDDKSHLVGKKFSDLKSIKEGRGPSKIIRYGPPYPSSTILFRKSALPSYGFDKYIKFSSDWKLMIDLVYNDKIFGYIDGTFLKYRIHEANVTKVHRFSLILEQFKIFFRYIFQYKKKYLKEWFLYFTTRIFKIS